MEFEQSLFNVVVGFAGVCGGWILKTLWEVIRDVQAHQRRTDDRMSALEVLVAGKYVLREDFDKTMSQVNTKLDYIVTTLSEKQDRH